MASPNSNPTIPTVVNEHEGMTVTDYEGTVFVQLKSMLGISTQCWKKRYAICNNESLYLIKNEDRDISEPCLNIKIEADTAIYPEEELDKERFYLRLNNAKHNVIISLSNESERNKLLACILTIMTHILVNKQETRDVCGNSFIENSKLNRVKSVSYDRIFHKTPDENNDFIDLPRLDSLLVNRTNFEKDKFTLRKCESLCIIRPADKKRNTNKKMSFVTYL